ncbi:MAG: hypothetical protein IKN48_01740 [Bacteroidaceae bacterium]|nr:hypothetical protein [Bacteroidaceae bacterium]
MKQSLLEKIIAFMFGNRYYANIVNTRGTTRCELTCFIFNTREQAELHRQQLGMVASFDFIETVSFRSRRLYVSRFNQANIDGNADVVSVQVGQGG